MTASLALTRCLVGPALEGGGERFAWAVSVSLEILGKQAADPRAPIR